MKSYGAAQISQPMNTPDPAIRSEHSEEPVVEKEAKDQENTVSSFATTYAPSSSGAGSFQTHFDEPDDVDILDGLADAPTECFDTQPTSRHPMVKMRTVPAKWLQRPAAWESP